MLGPAFSFGAAALFYGDCHDWLAATPEQSVHAVVTDPPFGLAGGGGWVSSGRCPVHHVGPRRRGRPSRLLLAGSGSTLAAAEAVGYRSVGVERDADWVALARSAVPALTDLAL